MSSKTSPEEGSIAPLGIGLSLMLLSLIFTFAAATSMFIFQKRLTNHAESAALFLASTGASVDSYLEIIATPNPEAMLLSSRLLSDEKTIEVIACANWKTPVLGGLEIAQKQICSRASARAEQ